jgi:chromate transporter
VISETPMASVTDVATRERAGLGAFLRYFLYLGSLGFGGPVALAGFMHRDLVEREPVGVGRGVPACPGLRPDHARGRSRHKLAIALGYFQHGLVGATAVGLAFIVPSFLMVLGISMAYVRFGGRVRYLTVRGVPAGKS